MPRMFLSFFDKLSRQTYSSTFSRRNLIRRCRRCATALAAEGREKDHTAALCGSRIHSRYRYRLMVGDALPPLLLRLMALRGDIFQSATLRDTTGFMKPEAFCQHLYRPRRHARCAPSAAADLLRLCRRHLMLLEFTFIRRQLYFLGCPVCRSGAGPGHFLSRRLNYLSFTTKFTLMPARAAFGMPLSLLYEHSISPMLLPKNLKRTAAKQRNGDFRYFEIMNFRSFSFIFARAFDIGCH